MSSHHLLASLRGRLLWDTPIGALPRPGGTDITALKPRFGVQSIPLDSIIMMPIDARFTPFVGRPMTMPIWGAVLLAAALAAAPWLRWRFSLRTLLIVTTLVAVVLGLAVYAARE